MAHQPPTQPQRKAATGGDQLLNLHCSYTCVGKQSRLFGDNLPDCANMEDINPNGSAATGATKSESPLRDIEMDSAKDLSEDNHGPSKNFLRPIK